MDRSGHALVLKLPHPQTTPFAKIITQLGQQQWTIALVLIFGIWLISRRQSALCVLLIQNIVLGSLLNLGVKLLIQRPRPDLQQLVHQGGYSFPSGHSANSLMLYGTLLLITYYLTQSTVTRKLATILAVSLVLLIGLSRVYLQVHYASDVLGGWSSALGNLGLSYWFSLRFYLPGLPPATPRDV
ncbi:MAG: phosphatase PAP2 family protein [Lactobacillus sp.]|nr:phosphatase PAP2 family protein [Lactobacillus sp.]